MSSSIPNLLASRGGPPSRGRGRGYGRGGAFTQIRDPAARRDQNIQATDTDAAVSRLSAVSLGYLDDPFAPLLLMAMGLDGTYTRTTALDTLIDSFLFSSTGLKQIISLGAGTDTRYFCLRARDHHHNILYHEFDFPAVSDAKRQILERHGLAGEETIFIEKSDSKDESNTSTAWGLKRSAEGVDQKGYFCHPLDLRRLPSLQTLDSILGLRGNVPTLIISECCLCYLEVDVARDVIKWFGNRIQDLGILLYEPIGVDDAFGQMMVKNLAARGIVMPTVQKYKTLAHQVERLAELGFKKDEQGGGSNAETIEDIWRTWISQEERERVDSLEGLDEVEEWQMLARHYSVVWGWKGSVLWDVRSPPSDQG